MLTAEFLVPVIIELVAGAASAVFLGNIVPPISLGPWKNAATGAIGGVVLTWLTARTSGLEQYVEDLEGRGGLSAELLVGVGAAGLIGGALLVTVVGLMRNRAGS